MERILQNFTLESLGICAEPSTLQKNLQSIAYKVYSLKLLQLRFTGKGNRKPRFLKDTEDTEDYEADSLPEEWTRSWFTAVQNGTTPPRRSTGPTETEIRET